MSGDDNTLYRVTIIPDSSFSFTAAAAAFLPAAYQRQPLCLSLPPPTSASSNLLSSKLPPCLYFSSPSFPFCPASANPSGQTDLFFSPFFKFLFFFFFFFTPRNLIEVIWLPISRDHYAKQGAALQGKVGRRCADQEQRSHSFNSDTNQLRRAVTSNFSHIGIKPLVFNSFKAFSLYSLQLNYFYMPLYINLFVTMF